MAVALSLALHAALLVVWVNREPRRQPRALQPASVVMQWMEVTVLPPAAPVAPAAPAASPPRTAVAAARVLPRPAVGRSAPVPTDPVPNSQNATAVQSEAGLASAVLDGAGNQAAGRASLSTAIAAPPQPAASSPLTASATPAAPAPWEADGIARALQRERAWQRRHGSPASEALAVRPQAHEPGPPMGQAMSVRESVGADGSRGSRVQGAAGTYCVRVPSANRLQDVGAAPRVAPVTNCP
ncbi:hypothetical protein [Acidovorax sp.]|uniref:hypothetical protein n=1 Tax=Acidovorax sp. TaxID=1872122 RepID=UPI002ACE3776|nr:hypothetical protein [Acidovorax sp.]MDZ7861642.1 hypothetical protein [Acidovorax sp.]